MLKHGKGEKRVSEVREAQGWLEDVVQAAWAFAPHEGFEVRAFSSET